MVARSSRIQFAVNINMDITSIYYCRSRVLVPCNTHNTSSFFNLYSFGTKKRRAVAWVLERSISISGRNWDNAISWLYCTITTYFHRFALLANLRYQNVFCCKSYLNCSWFTNFKPNFPKTGVEGHSSLQHSCDGEWEKRTFVQAAASHGSDRQLWHLLLAMYIVILSSLAPIFFAIHSLMVSLLCLSDRCHPVSEK
jgi:hypothetical protein